MTEDVSPTPAEAAEAHARLRASEPFRQQLATLDFLTRGFVGTLRGAWLAATRDPASANYLFWRFVATTYSHRRWVSSCSFVRALIALPAASFASCSSS